MRIKGFFSTAVLVLTATFGGQLSFAHSEDSSAAHYSKQVGFFTKGSVSDMSIAMESTEQPEMQFGPTKGFRVEKKVDPKVAAASLNKDGFVAAAPVAPPPGVDAQEFQLKQEFGDPSEPVSVKGVDSAPKPYKAMLKAIEMGRDDLALEYANQWMGYMKSLDRVTRKASAMAKVVTLDPSAGQEGLPMDALTNIDPKSLNGYMEQKKGSLIANQGVGELEINDSSREAINALFEDPGMERNVEVSSDDPYANLVNTNLDPAARKMQIRSALAGKLPVDPSGNVQILFFLRPSEKTSMDVAKELAKTISAPSLKLTNLSIVPLSVESFSQQASNAFFNESGLPALLRDGAAISKSLKLDKFPALVFATPNSQQAFVKTGKVDALFVEEVVLMIGGK